VSDIVIIVQVVRSQWLAAYYVEIGVIPVSFMKDNIAPNVNVCQEGCRATKLIHSPHRYAFSNLERDGAYVESELEASIEWLTRWIELHYGDIGALRSRFLVAPREEDEVPPSEYFYQNNIMVDWAEGILREPAFYYPDEKGE
jgi:hypothetical protein